MSINKQTNKGQPSADKTAYCEQCGCHITLGKCKHGTAAGPGPDSGASVTVKPAGSAPGGLTLRKGDFARFDSFAGLIAVKVLSIYGTSGPANSGQTVRFQITRTKSAAYKKGEILERSALSVAPVKAIHRRQFTTTIRPYYVEANCL